METHAHLTVGNAVHEIRLHDLPRQRPWCLSAFFSLMRAKPGVCVEGVAHLAASEVCAFFACEYLHAPP